MCALFASLSSSSAVHSSSLHGLGVEHQRLRQRRQHLRRHPGGRCKRRGSRDVRALPPRGRHHQGLRARQLRGGGVPQWRDGSGHHVARRVGGARRSRRALLACIKPRGKVTLCGLMPPLGSIMIRLYLSLLMCLAFSPLDSPSPAFLSFPLHPSQPAMATFCPSGPLPTISLIAASGPQLRFSSPLFLPFPCSQRIVSASCSAAVRDAFSVFGWLCIKLSTATASPHSVPHASTVSIT